MNGADLEALNIYLEAGNEPDEGKAAVARVVRNRMRARFISDGTARGTILAPDQFSWAYFGFVNHQYIRIAHTVAEAEAIAAGLFKNAVPSILAHCADIVAQVASGTYYTPRFAKLGFDAVSYLNPRILTKIPKWATPDKFLVSIGRHDFYGANAKPAPLVS